MTCWAKQPFNTPHPSRPPSHACPSAACWQHLSSSPLHLPFPLWLVCFDRADTLPLSLLAFDRTGQLDRIPPCFFLPCLPCLPYMLHENRHLAHFVPLLLFVCGSGHGTGVSGQEDRVGVGWSGTVSVPFSFLAFLPACNMLAFLPRFCNMCDRRQQTFCICCHCTHATPLQALAFPFIFSHHPTPFSHHKNLLFYTHTLAPHSFPTPSPPSSVVAAKRDDVTGVTTDVTTFAALL